MTAALLDGAATARAIKDELRADVASLAARRVKPGLGVLLVGDDPASAVYVRSKTRACEELGLCVSGRQARRLFKECTGMGIKEYRKKRRLGAAAEQLRTTDTPVKVIAGEAGYRHVSTFTKYFLKQFHLCPMDFRRIWREKDATAWQAQANDRTYSVYPRS